MKNRNTIVGGVLVLAIIAVGAWFFFNGEGGWSGIQQEVSTDDPITVVLDFYEPWLEARKATSTDPYMAELTKAPILSSELRARLGKTEGQAETEIDPVLCQVTVPEQISARILYELDSEAQVVITSTNTEMPEQSIVTLLRLNDGWYINDISCSPGEFAPDREFSFEQEGFLLKESLLPPLDSRYWHLVFEQNNEAGHVAQLFFDSESMCTASDGNTSVCAPTDFSEATRVSIKGQATESGIEVKQLMFVE